MELYSTQQKNVFQTSIANQPVGPLLYATSLKWNPKIPNTQLHIA